MAEQTPFVQRHAKRIELIFTSFIVLGLIGVIIYGYRSHKPIQTVTKIQTTVIPTDSEEYLILYNQFWQKFNSVAAVNADMNHDAVVSQTEINIYRNKFLSDMNLRLDPDQSPFILNEFNYRVSPEKLTCYLQHYDPKRPNRAQILTNC